MLQTGDSIYIGKAYRGVTWSFIQSGAKLPSAMAAVIGGSNEADRRCSPFEQIEPKIALDDYCQQKVLLAIIGVLTLVASADSILGMWEARKVELSDLFLLFIYVEIIGMIGAFYSTNRIPVTLPMIIAITALCRNCYAK